MAVAVTLRGIMRMMRMAVRFMVSMMILVLSAHRILIVS